MYKGKSSWYARWLLLPKGCDDGSLAKRFSAEAVAKYIKLHESFVERFKGVCDDPQGLALSLEYVRLQRDFSDRRKQPDLVVLMELTWMRCQCKAAKIWEGESALEELVNRTAGRHYASVPRFETPTHIPNRPLLPKEGDAVQVGRLSFQPVKLHFTGINATVPNSPRSSLSQEGAYVVVHGLVQCSRGIDVLWGPASITVMKEKGRAVEVFRDTKAEISDVCWDGKWLWAATRTGRILLVDPIKGTVKVPDAKTLSGVADLCRKDIVQSGEFLFFGSMAVKLADMSYHIQVTDPQGKRLSYRRASRCAFKLNDMLYLPPDDSFSPWIEVDPKTVMGEVIAEGLRLPKWNDYTYYRSWHYGVLGLVRSTRGAHYQVSVQEKAAGGNK